MSFEIGTGTITMRAQTKRYDLTFYDIFQTSTYKFPDDALDSAPVKDYRCTAKGTVSYSSRGKVKDLTKLIKPTYSVTPLNPEYSNHQWWNSKFDYVVYNHSYAHLDWQRSFRAAPESPNSENYTKWWTQLFDGTTWVHFRFDVGFEIRGPPGAPFDSNATNYSLRNWEADVSTCFSKVDFQSIDPILTAAGCTFMVTGWAVTKALENIDTTFLRMTASLNVNTEIKMSEPLTTKVVLFTDARISFTALRAALTWLGWKQSSGLSDSEYTDDDEDDGSFVIL